MSARIIYLTDKEFEILVRSLNFGSLTNSDSINIEYKLVFMRDKFEDKNSKTDYTRGFNDGLSANKDHPQSIMIMGLGLDQITKLISKHYEEIEMPTKPLMTRADAIAKFADGMGWNEESAERLIDIYIAFGMLEVKEEEDKQVRLTDKTIDILVNVKTIITLLERNGYVINKCNGEG